ncbi:FUSC family protein [Deinococcus sp. KNUC1210]|uniref:FUSC family protein n=1 Tax=Deinococcus sp. KNUC1210 TaxID=2917691 RepID=UPI001EF09ADC|nr:FUSC family protein [Deinococcus sp. KNUC1210]ULH15220.1 FUSC family protein [Deinococcus sp. KNUC1210]
MPSLTLLPDLGDLLRLQPQYNSATLIELLDSLHLREVLWLSGPDPDHPARDTLAAAGITVRELAPDWAWADAEYEALTGFMRQYPQGQQRLRAAGAAQQQLEAALQGPLTLARLTSPELLADLAAYHASLAQALDEGPGTRWHARRLDELAAAVQAHHSAAIVALDDLPGLLERLPHAELPAPGFVPGERSRLRALADRALLLQEHDDLSALLSALEREQGDRLTPRAELQYAAAGIHLAVGDLKNARALLESAAHALTNERSLPGLVLARLGQVRDAQGERDLATRTYRAVMALNYVPQVAREAAQAGLQAPFLLELE